jgi:hypothetical protein
LFNSHDLVHSEVSIVPYGQKVEDTASVASLIGTVDYDQKALGCAWCGEWAADSGQPLQNYFKIIVLHPDWLPYDIRNLALRPAVLYCEDCWKTHHDHFVRGFDLDPALNP